MHIEINQVAQQFTGDLLQGRSLAQEGGVGVFVNQGFKRALDLPKWAGAGTSGSNCCVEVWCAHVVVEGLFKKTPQLLSRGVNPVPPREGRATVRYAVALGEITEATSSLWRDCKAR